MRKKRVALYARSSTDGISSENQLFELQTVASRMNWKVVEIYMERGESWPKKNEKMIALKSLSEAAARHEFDLIMVWSIDRLAKSLQQLVELLTDIHAENIDLYIHKQGIDTTTPTWQDFFHFCTVFADFESTVIKESINTGLNRARAKGQTLGRPRTKAAVEEEIRAYRKEGMGIKKIAKHLGIGVGVVQRVVHETKYRSDYENP